MKKESIKPEELFITKVVSEWYDIQKCLEQLNRPFEIIVGQDNMK